MRSPWALAALLAVTAWAPTAFAHDQPYSFLDLRLSGPRLEGRLTAHVFDLSHEIGLAAPDSLLDSTVAARRAGVLRTVLGPRWTLVADGDTVHVRWTEVRVDRERSGLSFGFTAELPHPPGALRIEARLFPYDPQHETYVNVYESDELRLQELLAGERRAVTHYSGTGRGGWAVTRTFVPAGIHHIFIGPDHILFVIGLILLGGGLFRLFKIVTAFTLAHSVTLGLATIGWVRPPGWLIEPGIALSIVYIGLDNLRARRGGYDDRAWVAFGFGLLHGFGFAGVLRELGLPQRALGLSLVSFNVGVEIGQATIVLAAAPALAWLRARRPAIMRLVETRGSWVVVAAGTWWLFERVFPGRS
jgi:hydrogenase/urease accessory protein HupE